jgi:hypothetical protein
LDDLLRRLDNLLNDGNDWSRGRQIGLGLVKPTLDTVRKRNLLLSHSKRWEEGEQRDEAHDAVDRRTRVDKHKFIKLTDNFNDGILTWAD